MESYQNIPLSYVRGGTSTGVMINRKHLPNDRELLENILRKIMGVGAENIGINYNQITGLGRGTPTSNKVFIIDIIDYENRIVESELAQLSNKTNNIDWSVNCGNMTSAIPLFLLENNYCSFLDGVNKIEIFNKNTKKTINSYLSIKDNNPNEFIEIPGVFGHYPKVGLELAHPEGSKTGKVLPTGSAIDFFNEIPVSCVDVSVPMVIMDAKDLGLINPTLEKIKTNDRLMTKLKDIWVQAGKKMQLKNSEGNLMTYYELENSETIPKVTIIDSSEDSDIKAFYFTPQCLHNSIAISGAVCLASACLIKGTIAYKLTNLSKAIIESKSSIINIENPSGIMTIEVFNENNQIVKAICSRNSQIILNGYSKIYE